MKVAVDILRADMKGGEGIIAKLVGSENEIRSHIDELKYSDSALVELAKARGMICASAMKRAIRISSSMASAYLVCVLNGSPSSNGELLRIDNVPKLNLLPLACEEACSPSAKIYQHAPTLLAINMAKVGNALYRRAQSSPR